MQRTTNRSLNQYSKLESIYCSSPSALYSTVMGRWSDRRCQVRRAGGRLDLNSKEDRARVINERLS